MQLSTHHNRESVHSLLQFICEGCIHQPVPLKYQQHMKILLHSGGVQFNFEKNLSLYFVKLLAISEREVSASYLLLQTFIRVKSLNDSLTTTTLKCVSDPLGTLCM